MKRIQASAQRQRGAFLLEALIGILIFSMGILAMVGLQTLAVKASSEAKYRADASYLANQMISRMWATAPRDANGNLILGGFAHNGAANVCEGASNGPGTGDAVKASVQQWLDNIGNALPNATERRQQISIGANNLVTVSVCWQAPGAPVRNVVVTSQLRAD